MSKIVSKIEKQQKFHDDATLQAEIWALPLDDQFLEEMLRDLFENHWQHLTFGPMIAGGAYELRCPAAPKSIHYGGGYFTVHWGRYGHFHLCLGDSNASPELVAHRRPSKAELTRGFDKFGHPVTWSLQMVNGHGESTLAIYFPNPFLTDDDQIADSPDFTRLALWYYVMDRYAGHHPDGQDELGQGFRR